MLKMMLEINFFLIQCAIFYNQYNFAKALVGPNVRSAEENEFPFVVSIMRISNSTHTQVELFHRCTGTLVSHQHILTAEHCLRNILPTAFKVMVGSVDLALTSPYYPLFCLSYEQWAAHRQIWIEYSNNDIGFVKIIGTVSDSIPFVPLGNAPTSTLYGLDVIVAGWGGHQNNTVPRILQTVGLKVIPNKDCQQRITQLEGSWIPIRIHERHICTIGDPYALLNNGDSGGPLLFFGTLIAVNNGLCPILDGNLYPEQINMHTNIRNYRGFIEDVITSTNMNF